MNERIKQLAREAGFYANPDVEKFEKFAELIVGECASVALMSNGNNLYVYELIKQHFGVEE